jgi:hypothetical protein
MTLFFICCAISILLIAFHELFNLNTAKTILIAWSSTAFYPDSFPTLNPLLIVLSYFSAKELFFIVYNRIKLSRSMVLILIFPIVLTVIFYLNFLRNPSIFEIPSSQSIFLNPIYFYIKFYLAYFIIGHKIYREAHRFSLNELILFFQRLVLYACFIAVIQLLSTIIIPSAIFHELIGLKLRYRYSAFGTDLIRPNAFFAEPKDLALLLAMGTILFVREGKFLGAIFSFIIGLLTLSNTYAAIILLSIIYSLISRIFSSLYSRVLITFISFFLFFLLIEVTMKYLDEFASHKSDSIVYRVILKRMVDRYDEKNPLSGKMFYGFPLQADLEGPIQNYFEDNPMLFLTGFGPGNSNFVPNSYFYGSWAYEKRLRGSRRWHLNMGWFYWTYQFGLLGMFYLLYFCLRKKFIDPNHNDILSFIIIAVLVARPEHLLMIILVMHFI